MCNLRVPASSTLSPTHSPHKSGKLFNIQCGGDRTTGVADVRGGSETGRKVGCGEVGCGDKEEEDEGEEENEEEACTDVTLLPYAKLSKFSTLM